MTAESTNLLWRGAETIDAARAALADRADVDLHLPAGFHHAVHTRFAASASATAAETVDVAGGVELLTRLADIRGLERLAELELPVRRARARVRIVSPSPTITLSCTHARAAERAPR